MRTSFEKLRSRSVELIAAASPHLAARVDHPAVAAIAELMALDAVEVAFEIPDDHATAIMTTTPKVPQGTFAARLLKSIVAAARGDIDGSAKPSHQRNDPSISFRVNSAGLVDLANEMLKAGADLDDIGALHRLASDAASGVSRKLSGMQCDIVSAVLSRDLPTLKTRYVSEMVRWMLCLDHEGRPTRREAIARRMQAHVAYGAVQAILREKAITAVIDAGEQLAPALQRRLGIDAARLRAINGLLTIQQSQEYNGDRTDVVADLLAFDVPAHEWEEKLRSSEWISRRDASALSPDYVAGETAIRDTLSAFATDIVAPIVATRVAPFGLNGDQIRKLSGLTSGGDPGRANAAPEARRRYLGTLRAAIAGQRRGRAFREAAMIWHRRAACAAALRHENRGDEGNGWPAFCRPWTSADGTMTVTPIVTAAGLVEEGSHMSHCVGGYYDQCRSGGTHILAVRGPDRLAATLEILVSIRDGSFVMSRGQFKTYHDQKPDEELQAAMREFIADVTGGRHRIAKKEIAEHIRKEREDGDYRSGALDMDHARTSWPLYRVMMPRPTPETLDEWIAETGIVEAIDDVVRSMLGLSERQALAMAA
jgi:hypothetical protein